MAYYEYTCRGKGHSHTISTDTQIRSKKRLKCKYCGGQMQQVQYGYKEEKENAEQH